MANPKIYPSNLATSLTNLSVNNESARQADDSVVAKIAKLVLDEVKKRLPQDQVPSLQADQIAQDISNRAVVQVKKETCDKPTNPDDWDWKQFEKVVPMISNLAFGFKHKVSSLFDKQHVINLLSHNCLEKDKSLRIFHGGGATRQFERPDFSLVIVFRICESSANPPHVAVFLKAAIELGMLTRESINNIYEQGLKDH